MRESLDEQLAGIGRRVKAHGETVRAELERTALLGPVEAAKKAFNGKLTWLRTDRLEVGREPDHGTVPAPYRPRRVNENGRTVFTDGGTARDRL